MERTGRTELENLGEFGLIKHIEKSVKLKNSSTIKGIGDDAAIIEPTEKLTVVTTDMLVESIHFDLMYTPLKHLGYKSVVVNLSDVYAMNAQPKQITVSIALSNRFSIEAVEEFYEGINLACEIYGVDLVGGDTTSSKSGLVISVTAIGEADKKDIIYRNGAKEKDLIVVSGDLGAAYMGLQLLEREKNVFQSNDKIQPDLDGHDYVLERQLKPEARKDIINQLKDLKVLPTAMIDVSDGLASEIIHISNQSNLGCVLYEDKIPIDPTAYQMARDFNLDPTTTTLSGGEDYELLFTIGQKDYEKLKNNPNLTVIGYMADKNAGYHLVAKDNSVHELTAQGWNALLEKSKKVQQN